MPVRVQCEQCGSTYTLPDSRLQPGKRVQFACRHCQHRIVVSVPEGPAAGAASEQATPVARPASPQPARPASPQQALPGQPARVPLPANVMWFVASPSGQQQRMGADGIQHGIATAAITADTLLWRKGMGEWLRAGDTPEWSASFEARPSTDAYAPAVPAQAKPALAPTRPEPARPQPARSQPAPAPEPAVAAGGHVAGVASVHRDATSVDQRAVALPVIKVEEAAAETKPSPARPAGQSQGARSSGLETARPVGEIAKRAESSLLRAGQAAARADDGRETAVHDVIQPDRIAHAGKVLDSKDKKGPWSPATDTYTGPRGNVTRRVPEDVRQAAMEAVDSEADEADRQAEAQAATLAAVEAGVRPWRTLAVGAAAAAVVALALAALAAIQWRQAARALDECQAKCAPADAR